MDLAHASTISRRLQDVANLLLKESDQVLQERLGIGMSQYRIMQIVESTPKLLQRQVASRLHQTEASVSRQVALLLDAQLITITRNSQDRREHITALTPKGQRLAYAAEELLRNFHASIFEDLPEKQQTELLKTLETIEHRIIARKLP